MKKTLLAAAAFAIVLPFATPALAVEVICGTVSSADPPSGVVRLTDGTSYRVKVPVLLRGLAPGSHVVITVNNDRSVGIRSDTRYDSPDPENFLGSCPNG